MKKVFNQQDWRTRTIANTAAEADDTRIVLRELVVEVVRQWRKSLVNLIERGKREGDI